MCNITEMCINTINAVTCKLQDINVIYVLLGLFSELVLKFKGFTSAPLFCN